MTLFLVIVLVSVHIIYVIHGGIFRNSVMGWGEKWGQTAVWGKLTQKLSANVFELC